MAAGDSEGRVHIWRLPNHMTSIHSNEIDILDSLASIIKD
jgi:hypothetical protein